MKQMRNVINYRDKWRQGTCAKLEMRHAQKFPLKLELTRSLIPKAYELIKLKTGLK